MPVTVARKVCLPVYVIPCKRNLEPDSRRGRAWRLQLQLVFGKDHFSGITLFTYPERKGKGGEIVYGKMGRDRNAFARSRASRTEMLPPAYSTCRRQRSAVPVCAACAVVAVLGAVCVCCACCLTQVPDTPVEARAGRRT